MLVLIFLCDQSYASHGRDFLLGATILNPNERGPPHPALPPHERPQWRRWAAAPSSSTKPPLEHCPIGGRMGGLLKRPKKLYLERTLQGPRRALGWCSIIYLECWSLRLLRALLCLLIGRWGKDSTLLYVHAHGKEIEIYSANEWIRYRTGTKFYS